MPTKGSRCSSGCLTKDHKTFGECMRSKRLNLNPNLSDTKKTKDWDSSLEGYRDARRQGIQPDGTSAAQVERAERISQNIGQAYDAGKPMFDVAAS